MKVAINESWSENYGADGVTGGTTIPLVHDPAVQAFVNASILSPEQGEALTEAAEGLLEALAA